MVSDMLGQMIGNYRVLRQLGQGGMGTVYEAVHQQIQRRAAIKVLHSRYSSDPDIAGRFFNEARAVNIIEHPGLVEIYEFGQLPDGAAYIVMELLRGESLGARLKRLGGPLPRLDAVRLGKQVAAALSAAHGKGIIHRDLKPDNLMLVKDPNAHGGERIKVLDFGVAKIAAEHAERDDGFATQHEVIIGTPRYMSPEQCRGSVGITDRADVYALGMICHEMLTGRLPFSARNRAEAMHMHMYDAPRSLREADPTAPEELVRLVARMLAKAPFDRPTMAEVAERLERITPERATRVLESMPASATPSQATRLVALTAAPPSALTPRLAAGPVTTPVPVLGSDLGHEGWEAASLARDSAPRVDDAAVSEGGWTEAVPLPARIEATMPTPAALGSAAPTRLAVAVAPPAPVTQLAVAVAPSSPVTRLAPALPHLAALAGDDGERTRAVASPSSAAELTTSALSLGQASRLSPGVVPRRPAVAGLVIGAAIVGLALSVLIIADPTLGGGSGADVRASVAPDLGAPSQAPTSRSAAPLAPGRPDGGPDSEPAAGPGDRGKIERPEDRTGKPRRKAKEPVINVDKFLD